MNYQNEREVNLMVWEENPNKRNVNNIVKFNVKNDIDIYENDQIRCNQGGGKHSCYEILEIIEKRPSSISNMTYIIAKTKWFLE